MCCLAWEHCAAWLGHTELLCRASRAVRDLALLQRCSRVSPLAPPLPLLAAIRPDPSRKSAVQYRIYCALHSAAQQASRSRVVGAWGPEARSRGPRWDALQCHLHFPVPLAGERNPLSALMNAPNAGEGREDLAGAA